MNKEFVDEKGYYSVRYDEIISHFGMDKIEARFRFLYDKIKEYIDDRNLGDKVSIDEDILSQAIMDYFADIYRLKKFHGIERVNKSKIVSYEVYWLLRRKPIQKILSKDSFALAFVNEGFLTTFIAHELLQPNESAPLSEKQESEFLRYLQHVNYYLKYRMIDKQWLETILYSFEVGKIIE